MRRQLLAVPAALLTALALAVPAGAAVASPEPGSREPSGRVRLQYLGETELPHATQYRGTTVGGLSGISYDARAKRYLLISDDRSQTDPARTYTAAITAGPGRVAVSLTGTTVLRQPDGSPFPRTVPGTATVAPDPEGIAVDPRSGRFAWSSEGERILDPLTLADPTVRLAGRDGVSTAPLPTAPQLHVNPQPGVGVRQNQALEGLSYSPDGRTLWAGTEDPLLQDGDDPTPAHGALVRLTAHDAATGRPSAQFAYPLEPLFEAGPAGSTNGLSDLASLGGGRFLVLERAFTTRDVVRVFEASTTRATDVLGRDSLRDGPVRPAAKRLVVDLSKVKGLPRLDNVEGITVGPRLPGGKRLVVLVSDDNFAAAQVTQVIAFAATGL